MPWIELTGWRYAKLRERTEFPLSMRILGNLADAQELKQVARQVMHRLAKGRERL